MLALQLWHTDQIHLLTLNAFPEIISFVWCNTCSNQPVVCLVGFVFCLFSMFLALRRLYFFTNVYCQEALQHTWLMFSARHRLGVTQLISSSDTTDPHISVHDNTFCYKTSPFLPLDILYFPSCLSPVYEDSSNSSRKKFFFF